MLIIKYNFINFIKYNNFIQSKKIQYNLAYLDKCILNFIYFIEL